MAQQFVLKGVKDIRDYTSTDSTFTFRIKQDPRGGNTWQIPKWWNRKGNNTTYVSCTVFDLVDTPYLMIIPTGMDTQLQVTYPDDIYNITFSNFSSVDRILFTDKSSKKAVLEYLLPSISGGAVAKRIVQAAATIGAFSVTGKATVNTTDVVNYQTDATPSQSLTPTYAWTVTTTSGASVPTSDAEVANATAAKCQVTWKSAGAYRVNCTISATGASDSPKVGEPRVVTASVLQTVGTVTVGGDATPTAQNAASYTSSVSGNNVNDLEYKWSVVDATASIGNPNSQNTTITFDAGGNATVQCLVSSASIADTDSDTLSVVVASAKELGVVTVEGDTTVTAATAANYQASEAGGNVVDQTYQWTVLPTDGVVINTPADAATNITFNTAGTYDITCQVSSSTATNGPVSDTKGVTATAIDAGFTGVSLGGLTTVTTLNQATAYTSTPQGGGSLSGTTTYQWTVQDANDSAKDVSAEVEIATPTTQNTNITFKADASTYAVRCKYTNKAYDPQTKTGMRSVAVDTTA